MHIDVITTRDALIRLKDNWDDLYEKDPEAQFFLSWTFLSSYLRRFEGAWSILAARPGPEGTPYVALLPLRLRTRLNKKTGYTHNEINMGGSYAADYTGIVCAPGFADRAIPALAKHLTKTRWAKLHLENLRMSEKRRRLLLKNMTDERLTSHDLRRVNSDNVNNCICTSIDLPGDWETYLEQKASSNTRQKIRRFLRKLDGSEEFRITHADASTLDRDIGVILEMWRIKWGSRKGNQLPGLLRSNRLLFKDAFESGALFLPILWHGDKPLGGLAILVDPVKKAMLFQLAGRDETANDIPAGLVLHAYCIRRAIEQGFRSYDFLQGQRALQIFVRCYGDRHSLCLGENQDRPKSRRPAGREIAGGRVGAGNQVSRGRPTGQGREWVSSDPRCRSSPRADLVRIGPVARRKRRSLGSCGYF